MKSWLSETLDLGIHALTGGQGTTLVLVPGWPETAEAYSEVFPLGCLAAPLRERR